MPGFFNVLDLMMNVHFPSYGTLKVLFVSIHPVLWTVRRQGADISQF